MIPQTDFVSVATQILMAGSPIDVQLVPGGPTVVEPGAGGVITGGR